MRIFKCSLFMTTVGSILVLKSFAGMDSKLVSASIKYFTLEEYVQLSLKQGDRAITAYNNYQNSTFEYKISYRQLRLPSLTVRSSVNRTRNESDYGSDIPGQITKTDSASGTAELSQPIYPTGARLAASYSQDSSRFEDAVGTFTHAYTRPAYNLTLTQPLFLFVGNQDWRNWHRAQLSYDINIDNYKREMQSIELDATSLYYDVLLKKARMEVERSKSESSKKSFLITKALVDAGRLAAIDLSRSDVRLKQDLRRVQNTESDYKMAVHQALQFASLGVNTELEFTTKLAYDPLLITEEALVDYALSHRPDYLGSKRQVELAELSLKDTQESNNPTLNAVASLNHTDTGNGAPPDTITRYWSGGLNLSWPLFDSRVTALRVKEAQNNIENNLISLRGLERGIRTEVANAVLEVKTNEAQLDDLRTSIKQAKQSVESVRIRYQNGRDRLIDVFDSENDLENLQLEYLNVLVAANLAKDRLNLLVGGPITEVPK